MMFCLRPIRGLQEDLLFPAERAENALRRWCLDEWRLSEGCGLGRVLVPDEDVLCTFGESAGRKAGQAIDGSVYVASVGP